MVLLGIALLSWGCGQDPAVVYVEGGVPRVIAKVASAAQVGDLARVILMVEAEDMDEPTADTLLVAAGQRIFVFEVGVPMGLERIFTVRAEDVAGEVVYEGTAIADVEGGAPDIRILAIPTRFTLLMTPSDTTVSAGSSFEVGVDVYHVEEVFGVSFEVTYDPPGGLTVLSAAVGDFLESEVQLVKIEEGRVSISVVKKRGEVAMSGSGRLARLQVRAEDPGETVLRFAPEALALQRENGTGVPDRGTMIVGEARVVVQE